MDVAEFKKSLGGDGPPEGVGLALQALWHQAAGDWHGAHKLVQAQDDATGAWVHAYLHRVEGDEANAGHWYRRAGRPHSTAELDAEWAEIVATL